MEAIAARLGARLLSSQSEESLPASKIRLRARVLAIVEAVSDVVLELDRDGRCLNIWAADASRLARPRSVLLGRGVADVLGAEAASPLAERLRRVLSTGVPERLEYALTLADGEHWFLGGLTRLPGLDGGPDTVCIGVTDITDRQRTEQALARSEALFRALTENASDMVTVVDRDGLVIYESPSVARQHGRPPEQVIGRPVFERVHPDDVAKVSTAFQRVAETPGNVSSLRYRFRHRDGTWRVLETTGQNLLDDPAVHGIVLNTRDITDEVQAAEALRASETRFRALIENSMDLIAIFDAEGRLGYASPSARRILGYRPGGLVGEIVFDYVHPEDVARVREGFERAVISRDTTALREQFRFRHVDGSWRSFEAVASNLLDVPAVRGVVVNCRDVTERARAEEALRRSEAELRDLIESAPVGIYRSTREGRLLACNAALARMLGYDGRDELLGIDVSRGLYANPEERAQLLSRLAVQDTCAAEVRLRHKAGTPVRVRLNVRVVRSSAGDIECLEGVAEDVTEQRMLEEQFRQAQRLETVGRLAGGVAHDFNNILTAIISYAELLLSDLTPDDPKRGDVEEIRAAAQRAAALTRQLLAFSRRQVLQVRVVDLNAVVRTLERMLRRLIGEDVTLELALAEGLGAVRADPAQMEQVIMNLAVNARDAMPAGGHLTIETANAELDEVYAREHAGAVPGRYVMLAVSDTGIGMDAETRSHMFEPFFTTKGQATGTGLGLATVYGIIKQSDGHVWVYSEPGGGATFRIYLPLVDEPVEAQDVVPAARPADGGRETVLLAEDDPSVREVVARELAQKGYHVLPAPDGQSALEMARVQPGEIRLLLTDIVMPGMTGRELADALATQRPGLRALYMSGYTDDEVVRHGVLGEGLPHLQKPFTPGALAAKVREVLDAPVGGV